MEKIDILESKIKVALSMKAKLEAERREMLEELNRLRHFVRILETEKGEVKSRLEEIIDKIEIYLSREGK